MKHLVPLMCHYYYTSFFLKFKKLCAIRAHLRRHPFSLHQLYNVATQTLVSAASPVVSLFHHIIWVKLILIRSFRWSLVNFKSYVTWLANLDDHDIPSRKWLQALFGSLVDVYWDTFHQCEIYLNVLMTWFVSLQSAYSRLE